MTPVIAGLAAGAVAVLTWALWRRHRIRVRWRVLRGDPTRRRFSVRVDRVRFGTVRSGWGLSGLVALVVIASGAAGGPVAAVVGAGYAVVGTVALRRARTRRAVDRIRRDAVDAVAGLAGDLRAGLPVGRAVAAAAPAIDRAARAGGGAALVAARTGAAVRVAEASGAPLADVLERLDAHLRAIDRARAIATAQAAGVRASAALLAALPVVGLGLGSVIGVDPVPVLLRTPIGAAALLTAVTLQLAGLLWTARLARVEVAA